MEATVVCVDNSEFTRNGDYAPSRFVAQTDAVNLLAGVKTEHHPENTVGVMTMAGKTPKVLVTPTPDLGRILGAMAEMKIEGQVNLSTAVQIAQLALKHRENKNQRQRIVIFIGSPILEDKESLVKIAKKLKKNNVAVDIVSFGSEEENTEKLEAFHGAVNSNDNSHLVTVPVGTILSDMLFSTPIFMEDGAGGGGDGGSAPAPRSNIVDGFDYGELGVDPTLDPELALALRVSLEEERARQAAAAGGGDGSGGDAATATGGDDAQGTAATTTEGGATPLMATAAAATPIGGGAANDDAGVEAMDEDALLQQALALSMQVDQAETPAPSQQAAATPAAPAKPAEDGGDDAMLEVDDPELALALQMSLAEQQPGDEKMEEEKKE